MIEQEFERIYKETLEKFPNRFSFGEPPSSIELIERAEEMLGSVFPSAYRSFLAKHGAGEVAFVVVYSPDPKSYWSIVERNIGIKNGRDFYAISDDQCGNYYGFSRDGGDKLFFLDHDLGAWLITEYSNFFEYFSNLSLLR